MSRIPVYGRVSGINGIAVAYTLVDPSDEILSWGYRWHLGGRARQYAMALTPHGTVLLHRLIVRARPGQRVKHLNGDRLDNRRENLWVLDAVNVVGSSARGGTVTDGTYTALGARS